MHRYEEGQFYNATIYIGIYTWHLKNNACIVKSQWGAAIYNIVIRRYVTSIHRSGMIWIVLKWTWNQINKHFLIMNYGNALVCLKRWRNVEMFIYRVTNRRPPHHTSQPPRHSWPLLLHGLPPWPSSVSFPPRVAAKAWLSPARPQQSYSATLHGHKWIPPYR